MQYKVVYMCICDYLVVLSSPSRLPRLGHFNDHGRTELHDVTQNLMEKPTVGRFSIFSVQNFHS